MRKILSFTLALIILGSLFVRGGKRTMSDSEKPAPKMELIDIKADVVYPHRLGPDSSVLCLVGNFAAQHNGAVITADSAVRYNDERIDCFGNVLINKNTTYAYADRAVYDGANNEIRLYSPIVKVIDEGVTLYTYNFKYNTLDNIGTYWGGGVATNTDSSRLESARGLYFSDLKEVVGVESVEIYTTNYELRGDSVIYNMDSENVRFFDNTNIWNKDGDYLYTDQGTYNKEEDLFSFTQEGYMLTAEREVWSDSMDYFQTLDETILRGNIQMDDTTNKMLVYSDFAHHWGEVEKLFLTQNPLVVNYDPEQTDTLFMRGDTIILTTHNSNIEQIPFAAQLNTKKEESVTEQSAPAPQGATPPAPSGDSKRDSSRPQRREHDHDHDHDHDHEEQSERAAPTPAIDVDSLPQDTLPPLSKKEAKAKAKAEKIHQKEEEERLKIEAQESRAKLIEERLQQSIERRIAEIKLKDSTDMANAAAAAAAARDSIAMSDTTAMAVVVDSLAMVVEVDSLANAEVADVVVDTLSRDTLAVDSLVVDTLSRDSIVTLTPDEIESLRRVVIAKIDSDEKKKAAEAKRLRAEAISKERIRVRIEKIDAQKARAARAAAARKAKTNERLIKRGKTTAEAIAIADSLDSLRVLDSLNLRDSIIKAAKGIVDVAPKVDSLQAEVKEPDSIFRIVVAYRNTKTYQGEQQSVSDSLLMDSRDTTLHLYIDPYIWNGMNQVSSEVMDIYTLNKELHQAVFTGSPIMSSKIDTTYYNQVAGKTITSHFRDNDLVRNDVDGNVQTIYFVRDEDTGEVTTMVYLESGSASFYIKDQELEGITYRIQPSYVFYPVALIPDTQPMRLEGFKWQESLRPRRRDFSFRAQRPSLRQQKDSLPRPDFPIERAIRKDIDSYVKDRYWMDRTDVVASHAEEWLESLGYKSGQPRTEPIK